MREIDHKGTSDLRTGGYSDVDMQFEKKHSQQQMQEEDDDAFDQMMEQQEQESDQDSVQDGKNEMLEVAIDVPNPS